MTEVFQRPAPAFGPGSVEFVGVHEGVEAGREIALPVRIRVDGRDYAALAGSDLRVDPAHRQSHLGLLLPEEMRAAAPDGVAVAAAVSEKARPVYVFLGFCDFPLTRFVLPLHVRRHCGWLAGAAVAAYRTVLRALVLLKTRGLSFERVDAKDDEALRAVAALVAADAHACSEVHDAAWLRRHLTDSFTGEKPLQLTVVKRAGRPVGFFLLKFRRKARVRELKNVRLGFVVEWQFADGLHARTGWLLARAALESAGAADFAEIATDDAAVMRLLRRLGARAVGSCDIMVGVSERSPLAENATWRAAENWRLRPAMADNGLC